MSTVPQGMARGYRTVRLPIAEADYERFLTDTVFAKTLLSQLYDQHPELFPPSWHAGYALYGLRSASRKQALRYRRVRLSGDGTVWTLAPGFVLPYQVGRVKEVEKALFLMRFHGSLLGDCVGLWTRPDVLVSTRTGAGTAECGGHDGENTRGAATESGRR